MTYREKWNKEHPDEPYTPGNIGPGCVCGYFLDHPMKDAKCSLAVECTTCWDREMPETKPDPIKEAAIRMAERLKASANDTMAKLHYEHSGEPIAKVVEFIESEDGGFTAVMKPVIKDSGDRTQFESGAVRDMREGKGRCDLMPLKVVAEIFGNDPILEDIACFMDEEDEQGTGWLYGALDNFGHKAYGSKRTTMLLEVAKHFEEGAKKYGENNWQKGIPVHCYIDSAVRHYLKWLRGDNDEPHDRAFVWNIMCCIWEVDYHDWGKNETKQPENKLLPVTKAHEQIRLGDFQCGLFKFDGQAYVKSVNIPGGYVNVLDGTVRGFIPDILIEPLEIWEVDGDEDDA